MNPMELIKLHEDKFTKSEIKIMNFILENPEVILKHPLITAANYMKVSKSALLRFTQKIGYKGYPEFKYEISKYLQSGNLKNNTSYTDIVKLFSSTIGKINDTLLYEDILNLAKDILSARKIKIYGIHESGLSATQLYYRLTALGIDSQYIVDDSIAEMALFSSHEDLNIYFTISSTTDLIIESIKNAYTKKSKIAIISQNGNTKVKKLSDYFLLIPSFNISHKDFFIDPQVLNYIIIEILINAISKMSC